MLENKTFLAVILARGGSKRLPRKNALTLAGKPLVAWSIEAALNCSYIDMTVVSSDDDEILTISSKWGAEPMTRPEVLATDTSTSFDAIEHVIKSCPKHDYVVLLQPTSPLREAKHIAEAIELLISKKADALVSVCETEHSPLWCNTLPENMEMSGFLSDDIKNKRSQDLPKYYRLNGAVYICDSEVLLREKTFFLKNNVYAYRMQKEVSVDIDDRLDFMIAELLLENRMKNET